MLKEEFEELIKREVNENQYKNIETAYEALPEYMDKEIQYLSFSVLLKKIESIYGLYLDELVKTYFPELEEKKSMATEPEEEWRIYGWFGCISPETKEVRLNIVKDIIKELEQYFC